MGNAEWEKQASGWGTTRQYRQGCANGAGAADTNVLEECLAGLPESLDGT